jgi:hypothetical protein
VLQARELIGVGSRLAEELLHDRRLNVSTYRSPDGALQLVAA